MPLLVLKLYGFCSRWVSLPVEGLTNMFLSRLLMQQAFATHQLHCASYTDSALSTPGIEYLYLHSHELCQPFTKADHFCPHWVLKWKKDYRQSSRNQLY